MGISLANVNQGLGNLFSTVFSNYNRVGGSIMSATKRTNIISRMFMDESIADEEVIPWLNTALHKFYVAQIIAGFHLSKFVTAERTVEDLIRPISSAAFKSSVSSSALSRASDIAKFRSGADGAHDGHVLAHNQILKNDADEIAAKREANRQDFEDWQRARNYTRTNIADQRESNEWALADQRRAEAEARDRVQHGRDEATFQRAEKQRLLDEKTSRMAGSAIQSVKVGEGHIGSFGELMEIKLQHPENPSTQITVPIFVQINPYLVSAEAAPRMIDLNVSPPLWHRLIQWQAGEISFWKDLVFWSDVHKRNTAVFKDDATREAFDAFYESVSNKDSAAFRDLQQADRSKISQNLANSIMVFSKDTVERARIESGIDLYKHMKDYYRQTYTMIVVIVDPSHKRVSIHFNGMDNELNLPYAAFKPKGKNGEAVDFVSLVQAMSQNNLGRMR